MSIRNYNTAILQNENNRLAILQAGLELAFTNMLLNENVYLAWDDEVGFYATTADKNVHVETDGLATTGGNATLSTVFAMSDVLGSWIDAVVGNLITVYYNRSSGGVRVLAISERLGGVNQDSIDLPLNFENIHYWRENKIDWDAATLTVTWYTNSLRTIPAFTPQVISLTKDRALQYMYGQQSFNTGIPGGGTSGFEQNFNQITPVIGANAAYYQQLLRNNRSGRN